MSLVSLAKIPEDTVYGIKQAITNSLNLINYEFKKDMKNVVIKTNLCYYWDFTTGQTTDPRFIASLIDIIREKTSPDIDIAIIESDASAMKCKYAFKMLGYDKLSEDRKVKLVNLSEDKTEPVRVSSGGKTFEFDVPQTIKNADLRISTPKIKYTMDPIKITCALKNIFGCNPFQKKYKYHPYLGETIVALNKVMKFDLIVIDGNIVSGIQPCKLGLVMASQDPVAIDAAASIIASVNPRTIKYLQLAEKEGVGNIDFASRGEPINYFKKNYPRKTFGTKMMGRAVKMAISLGLGKRLGIE